MYADTQTALVSARAQDLRAEAGRDHLARLAACCRTPLRAAARRAGAAVTQWLRHGQLQVPLRCCDWPA